MGRVKLNKTMQNHLIPYALPTYLIDILLGQCLNENDINFKINLD